MSLRYDAILALSDKICFVIFLFQSSSIYPLNHKNLHANINNVCGEIYCKKVLWVKERESLLEALSVLIYGVMGVTW